jgi:hypothetical protein
MLMAGLWLLAPVRAHALDPTPAPAVEPTEDDELADSADEKWGLRGGLQGDRVSSLGVTGEVSYDVRPSTTLHVGGHATDYRPDPPPGQPGTPRSIAAEFGVQQRFGHFAIDGAFGHWLATHVVKADELNFGGSYANGGFSGGLRAGYRHSRFSTFATTAVADFGHGVQGANVLASCQVKNTAFGADGRWQGPAFGVHASATAYQYHDATCGLTAPGIGYASRAFSQPAFAALASDPLSRLSQTALPVIGQQPSLSKSLGLFGVSWRRKDKGLALDYLRQQDYFRGTVGYAYFATATAFLGGSTGIDVTFGRSQGGGQPRGLFGGLGLRARF